MTSNNTSTASFTSSVLQSCGIPLAVPATVAALVMAVGLVLVFSKTGTGKDSSLLAEEPPEVKSRIPFIGHLLGMLKWQVGYVQMLSSKYPSYQAFTLKVFASRIYVICEPSLIQAAYRNTKAFHFGSFVVESSKRAFDIGEHGMRIIRGETAPGYDPHGPFLNGNDGDSYLNENHKVMIETLRPGPALLELNRRVLNVVADTFNHIDEEGERIRLFKWTRDTLTSATAEALYGPQNPIGSDRTLIDALWDFEEHMTILMLSIIPTILAPRAYRGRLAIKEAFTRYYAAGHNLSASTLVQSRLACCLKWGFTATDIANFEISTLFLATTNTVPSSFWLLSYILTDPSSFSAVRDEVSRISNRRNGADGMDECEIDITKFHSDCPLLLSCWQETLRLVDAATSVRAVVQDVKLSSSSTPASYLLKAGGILQLPSGVTHSSQSIWLSDTLSFKPTRFLKSTKDTLSPDERRNQKQGFFPFGGGKNLCPGRHFATTEVLAFVSTLILGFEIDGMRLLGMRFQKLGTGVRKPNGDLDVTLRRRKGWENVRWMFEVGRGAGLEGGDVDVDFAGLMGED